MKNDTISRKALLKELRKELRECRKDGEEFGGESILWAEGIEFAIDAVKEAPTIEATPCSFCRYNPPSSGDGKPCAMCPASAKEVQDA